MKIRIKNKKRFTIVLSIVLVLIAMISGAYSLFYRENTASNKEDYTTGILSIVAKSKSDNINLTNALPMTDEEGAQTEPYVFNIENVGNLDYNFKIRLLSTSANPINPDYIKLKIDDGEVTTLSSLTNSIIKDNITLKAKETMDVSIRIWLASNTPNTEIGKSFNSKIVTEGQAVYTEVNNEAEIETLAKYITKLYNDNKDTTVTNNEIEYQYATSVNLMNDRLGGTTSLDGGNIRYYGPTPKNYIDIGDRTNNNEVILWRIIGVFDGKLRVVRDESIGEYSWDTSPSDINDGYGINEWSQADIMKLLNPGYANNLDQKCVRNNETSQYDCEDKLINNSLWWNSESGICYNARYNGTTECDFTNTGLSDKAKDYVDDQTIYLGGFDTNEIYANEAYANERGDTVIQNSSDGVTRTLSWTGKVSLPYPSDYGYATDLNECTKKFKNYGNVLGKKCKNNNWLSKNKNYWFLSSHSLDAAKSINVIIAGNVLVSGSSYASYNIYPVFTLSSNTYFESGTGDSDDPYVVK